MPGAGGRGPGMGPKSEAAHRSFAAGGAPVTLAGRFAAWRAVREVRAEGANHKRKCERR